MDTYVADVIQSYRRDPSFTLLSYTVYSPNLDQPKLAGNPAYDLLSTLNSTNGERFLQHEIGTIVGNQTYYVIYSSPTAKYALFEDLINQMIDSLEIYPPSSHLPVADRAPINDEDVGLI